MATRCYFPLGTAAPVTAPNPTADWGHIQDSPGGRQRKLLFWTPSATTLTTEAYTPDAADHLTNTTAYHRTYVSDPIAAQTTGGNIKGQFQILEALANCNLFLTFKAYVVSNDGVTVRSPALLAITRDTTTEAGTTINNRNFPSTALGAVTASEGDRIVLEIGLGGNITSGTGGTVGHNGSIRWGDNGSGGDLPEDDTTTTATLRGWVEFSTSIKVRGEAAGSIVAAATLTGASATFISTVGTATSAATLAATAATVLAADGTISAAATLTGDGEAVAAGPTIIETDGAMVAAATLTGAGAAIWLTASEIQALAALTGQGLAVTGGEGAMLSAAAFAGVSSAIAQGQGDIMAVALLTGHGEDGAVPPPSGVTMARHHHYGGL